MSGLCGRFSFVPFLWRAKLLLVVATALLSFFDCKSIFAHELRSPVQNSRTKPTQSLKLTLVQALDLARTNYPEIKAAIFRREGTEAGIQRARTAYLPKGSMVVQELRATSNNITGPLLPQFTIPSIAGAVNGGTDLTGGWLSAAGTLVSWEPFDFGLRSAQVNVAKQQTQQAAAQLAVTELDVESTAADSFLRVLHAQQVVKAAQAKLHRLTIFSETVQFLAQKELRAATDEYLAQAEVAKARDEVTEAEQSLDLATISLSKSLGLDNFPYAIDGEMMFKQPTNESPVFGSPFAHPVALAQQAAVNVAHAKRRVIAKTFYPQFNVLGALYGRGSGFNTDVSINQYRGYYPTKFNYAAGLSISFPFLDIFQLRADQKIATKSEAEERARYDLVVLNIKTRNAEAQAVLRGAQKIAANAPVKVTAATEAARSTEIRYRYGLASVNDVALNEQLLTQSQVDFATAQLRVWRALLAVAVANGDLKPFRTLVDEPRSQGAR
jgi:outer membrane protein